MISVIPLYCWNEVRRRWHF